MINKRYKEISKWANISEETICIDISEVVNFSQAETYGGKPNVELPDCPTIAPPWELAWYQWKFNTEKSLRFIRSSPGQVRRNMLAWHKHVIGGGVLEKATLIKKEDRNIFPIQVIEAGLPSENKDLTPLSSSFGEIRKIPKGTTFLEYTGENPGWILRSRWFCFTDGKVLPKVIFGGESRRIISEEGKFKPDFPEIVLWGKLAITDTYEGWGEDEKRMRKQEHDLYLSYLSLAKTFIHCKNVEVVQRHSVSHGLKNQIRRKNKRFFNFKTLDIQPVKRILEGEGSSRRKGLKYALHVCSGHFRTYAPDGPGMFGKGIIGTFWIPDTIRGRADKGVVVKDYHLKKNKMKK